MSSRIGFIGGGNMATSLIGGILESGTAASDIMVIDPVAEQRTRLQSRFGIETADDSSHIESCNVVILAVKPQVMRQVCQAIKPASDTLYISIAAGIPTDKLAQWLSDPGLSDSGLSDPGLSDPGPSDNQHGDNPDGDNPDSDNKEQLAIIRCMPNTPALLQCGASGLYANEYTSDAQRDAAQHILEAVGIVVWVDNEDLIDAVTAVSGSGPAYYFLMMEAMQKAGESLGLSAEVSRQLVLQTALGAARMATEGDDDPATLRNKVTSKGGTTEQAINSFQSDGFEEIVRRALTAARDRGRTLARELTSDDS